MYKLDNVFYLSEINLHSSVAQGFVLLFKALFSIAAEL